MAALTAKRETAHKGEMRVQSVKVKASTTIYGGGIVCSNAGFAAPGADTAGLVTMGIALQDADNSSGGDGDISVEVGFGAAFLLGASSITQAMVGLDTLMDVIDDQTFDETSTNSVVLGKLIEFVSTTSGWVYVPGLARV